MPTPQDPRETWLATGACSQFGGGCRHWGRDCPLPSSSRCLPPASLPPVGEGPVCSQLALLLCLLNPLFCEWARLCVRLELLGGKLSLSLPPPPPPAIPQFGLLFHISSSGLSSGHSGSVLTLSMQPVPPLLPGSGRKCLDYFSSGSCS